MSDDAVFLFIIVILFAILSVPIWTLLLLYSLRSRQQQQEKLLNSVLYRLDRMASAADKPPASSAPTAPIPAPAVAPPPPPKPAPAPPPAPRPAEAIPPPPPRVAPPPGKTKRALQRIWNWIVINEEFRPAGMSWEFAVATTWLIRLAVITFVIGIGFFLKYSVEHGLLGPHARILLSTFTGIAMVAVGTRLLGKAYHLLGQGLLGGGFAVLYFSAFSAHSFYQLLGALPAFGLMALITLCAGVFAVRFNSLLVAVLGILGGYSTPILLETGAKNFGGLFGYLLVLGFGVLGIARRRQWPLLNHLAMLLTYLLAGLSIHTYFDPADFPLVMPFLAAFFLLFSAAMIFYNLRLAVKATLLEILGTTANALIFFALGYHLIIRTHSHATAAVLALALAAFYLAIVYRFLSARRRDRGLLLAFLALTAFFLALIPPLAFSQAWITLAWALQGLVMLWLAGKLDSRFLRGLSLAAYTIALMRLIAVDLHAQYAAAIPADLAWTAYGRILANHLITIGGPIAALGGAWWLLRRPPATTARLSVTPDNDIPLNPAPPVAITAIATLTIALLFVCLHVEFYRAFIFFWPPFAYPSLSILWLFLGWFLLTLAPRRSAPALRYLIAILAIGFIIKLLIHDAAPWRPNLSRLCYATDWSATLTGIRTFDFALCIGLLTATFARLRATPTDRWLAHGAGISALVLLFLFLSFETNTALSHFLPPMRAGGLTLLWALYALAMLLAGLRHAAKGLRYAGLTLFAVVIAKIFLFDLAHLESLYRILAFILLGILLFLAALLYLRNRTHFQPPAGDTP